MSDKHFDGMRHAPIEGAHVAPSAGIKPQPTVLSVAATPYACRSSLDNHGRRRESTLHSGLFPRKGTAQYLLDSFSCNPGVSQTVKDAM
jgi:hypothetical protein